MVAMVVSDLYAASLGNVHTLDLTDTNVTDAGGNVHTLNLSRTKVDDVGAAALGKVHSQLYAPQTKILEGRTKDRSCLFEALFSDS